MKEEALQISRTSNRKTLPKLVIPVFYGQKINIKNLASNKQLSLWGRGFIDKNIYLSSKADQIQSQFTIEPKKGLYSFEDKTTTPVVFGAEVLIKHVLSQQYISIGEHDDMPVLQFQKQQSSYCYFELTPLRTFQSNGNAITSDSIFLIFNTQRKLYITDQQEFSSQTQEPSSPTISMTKRITQQQAIIEVDRSHSGSISAIPAQSEDFKEGDISGFKKKNNINKAIPSTTDELMTKTNTNIQQDKLFRKSSQHSGFSRTMSFEAPVVPLNLEQSSLRNRIEIKKEEDYVSCMNGLINSLPIYNKETDIHKCNVENYSYSQWKIDLAKTELQTSYLNNNDYIYFIHSQANEIMTLDIQKFPPDIAFVKHTSEGENQYILNSIFVVEIERKNSVKCVYLKHLLTGKYFPPAKKDEERKTCDLVPLLVPKKNQFPPFRILFNGEDFQKKDPGSRGNLHGFFLNKIPKKQIAEIMSLQNVDKDEAIQYLIDYLRTNTRKKQKILRQFLYIPKLINQLTTQKSKVTQNQKAEKLKQAKIRKCYQLLFYLCRNNEKNKKQCLKYVDKILDYPKKQQMMDLLTELLIDGANGYIVEKAITPQIIEQQVNELISCQGYSVSFMRIFRVFCGPDEQPSIRNRILLFNLFFWGEEVIESSNMTESALYTQKKISLPNHFKFKVYQQQGNIYFSNGNQNKKYEQIDHHAIQYIRQYFYLLSDCMNGNNYPLIRKFTQSVSFDLLLKLLEKQKMKSPTLALIFHAYLKPQKKYKPYIFHQNYEKICQKGSLISFCNQSEGKLRNFLEKQIRQNKRYEQTLYRILLNVFKLSIENGYWRKFQDLIDLMGYLDGVLSQPQPDSNYHDTYQQKANDRNLLKSKITAISIRISLIDMQVSLWASDYISGIYSQPQIEQKNLSEIKKNKNWIIEEKIMRLCSTNSPQLIRKAILLLYKIYNMYKLTQKTYEEAIIESKSKKKLQSLFITLQLKEQMQSEDYFCIISACVKDVTNYDELDPKNVQKNNRNLQSFFKYKQVNEQVQNMTYKLGLHEVLISSIKRYLSLPKKQKQKEEEITYWKLLTILAMIRNNSKLRDIIAENRSIFITLMQSEGQTFYVTIDIIQEIYRNNRKLIISDNQELKEICKCVDKVYKVSRMDLRYCKAVNLLSVFIETGNRKIVENYQIILQNVFTKNFVKSIIKMLTKQSPLNRKESVETQNKSEYFRHILQIVIYDLLVTMGQKKLLASLQRPSNQTIYALLLGIGNSNWNLKGKSFLCINFDGIKQKMVKQFMGIILFDLNVMCQSLKVSHLQFKEPLKEVKIYISNIIKILDTIDNLFKTCTKKLEDQESEEEFFVIKIVERLFIMKALCPEIVHKKIDNLLRYINIIEKKMDRKSQYTDLCKVLRNIDIGDFEKNEIKERLPLIYSQKIKNQGKRVNKISSLDQKNSLVESALKKKGKIEIKTNELNKNRFQNIEDKLKQLKTLILSLSNLNKTDSSFLSDNIKQFLINFIKTSYLESQNEHLTIMQNELVHYEVPTIVCSILAEPFKHRYKLFCSTFELGIKLLEGGHTKCQQKFMQKFKQDGKNWIFQNIYQIILDSLATIQFYYNYKQDPTIKSYQMVLQLEEYYACKEERKLSCQLLGHAFRFLQLLCQNDNHLMKQYVYNQLDKQEHIKYTSKNFIQLAQRVLDGVSVVIEFNIYELEKMPNPKFEEQVRANIFSLPIFILDFLIEVCQIPADQNQLYLCRTDFLDFIKKLIGLRKSILTQFPNSQEKEWNIFFSLQRKLIILLRSLLEVNSQQIENLMRKKIGNSEFTFFIEQSFVYGGLKDTQKLQQMLTEMQLNSYVQNIVDVLIIKKALKTQGELQFKSDDPNAPDSKNQQKMNIVNELNSRIQSIEVDFKTHSLTVYFPFHPLFAFLSKKTKDFILDRSVGLSTRRQKLTQLLISRQVIYKDINHQKNSQTRMMNSQKMGYLFDFALVICYLIVLLLVLFYSVDKSGTVLDIYEVQIISGLSYLQLIVACIYAGLMGINLYPIARQKIKTAETLKRRSFNGNHNNEQDFKQNPTLMYLRMLKNIYIDQQDSTHALILLIISLYACFGQVRVYSFALIFAFSKIQLLGSILKSLKLTWQQLAFVSLLALAFSFIFGFITLNYYIGPLYQNQEIDIDIDRINQHCNTIITCLSSLYTQKIIGESVSRSEEEYNYGRFISDLVHWGFFEILLSNIIAAIIIDKFAEQRNAKQKIEHQKFSKCYICFADRSTLERRGQDFMSHVDHVHNIWNYFFYMYSLEYLKDLTDFTGIQYWINRQVKNNLIDWIPIDDSFKDEDANLNALVEKLRPLVLEKQGNKNE